MNTCTQIQIVLAGSGEQTIAAYKTFAALWGKQLKKKSIRIIIITGENNYECNDLFGELISGRLEAATVSIPLAELVPLAHIIHGDIASIDKKTKQLHVTLKSGGNLELWYDHLVLDPQMAVSETSPEQADHIYYLNSTEHVRLLCRQIDLLVKQAAIARNPLAAKNLLRFVLLVKSAKDIGLVAFIDQYLAARCSRYYALQGIRPECIVIDERDAGQTSAFKNPLLRQLLISPRITWIQHQKVQRITSEAVVLDNGSFLAASMIIRCSRSEFQKQDRNFAVNSAGEIITDSFLRVKGENFIWCSAGISNQPAHETATFKRHGKHIARNIIAAMECQLLRPFHKSIFRYDGVLFPRIAVGSMFGITTQGRMLRHLHLLWLLFLLPSSKMRSEAIINLVSHFLWKKTKLETGLIHYGFASGSNMRAAS